MTDAEWNQRWEQLEQGTLRLLAKCARPWWVWGLVAQKNGPKITCSLVPREVVLVPFLQAEQGPSVDAAMRATEYIALIRQRPFSTPVVYLHDDEETFGVGFVDDPTRVGVS